MIEYMSLEEQVDKDFAVARRHAWLRRLKAFVLRRAVRGTLLCFDELRRSLRAVGGIDRGRRTVEISRIIGSSGKYDQFDDQFMPRATASAERWKRIDRAVRRGIELPPVYLYKLGDIYFVKDGHNRVSVARFHGAEWIDAEVTEFRAASSPVLAPETEGLPPVMPGTGLGLA